jgi:thiosulfate/3-mercaptopyruvate sulfurtransferase
MWMSGTGIFQRHKQAPLCRKGGQIAGAVNLPTAQVFEKYPPGEHLETCCYTLKDKTQLKNMLPRCGQRSVREIIVYCDSGRVASSVVHSA